VRQLLIAIALPLLAAASVEFDALSRLLEAYAKPRLQRFHSITIGSFTYRNGSESARIVMTEI
jgi:hypothetical protein